MLLIFLGFALATDSTPAAAAASQCGTQRSSRPQDCLALAIAAMGGSERLQGVHGLSLETVQHVALVEQSYRQEPFITAYVRTKEKIDFSGGRLLVQAHQTWPESDPGQFESDATLVVGPAGAVYRGEKEDSPAARSDVEDARYQFDLEPVRVLLTALHAPDLHFMAAERVRSTLHPVLAFTWHGHLVRVMVNPFNFLPDAVEFVSVFYDHWYQWGDVRQRIYFDNWQLLHGLVYPTNQVVERNGIVWESVQVVALDVNPLIDEADFKTNPTVAAQARDSKGWEKPFKPQETLALADGVTLYAGSWNATVVKLDDGLILLESPISGTYTAGLIDKMKAENPGLPIQAVLSTSDSWPHVGGVRQAVAMGLPVYILDLNRPLLDRLIGAPRKQQPDLLARVARPPVWRTVAGKVELGHGKNRLELYPLRGAATERQYMVYFPEQRLLYASDTLVLQQDGSLYAPELMREVVAAVKRENLAVTTVYAMHQRPVPWARVTELVSKAVG
jgi:hypothetical protein